MSCNIKVADKNFLAEAEYRNGLIDDQGRCQAKKGEP
jgi:hypothetical protein